MSLESLPTNELLRNFAAILAELRRREICRSENIPTGDLAEYLVCKALGLSMAPKSAKGFDALSADGQRFQIKGRRITRWNPSLQLSAIRDLKKAPFDFVVAVLFDEEFQVISAHQFSLDACQERARFVARTNSHTIFANASLISHPDTVDLTDKVSRAFVGGE